MLLVTLPVVEWCFAMNVITNINGSKKRFKCKRCGIDLVKMSNAHKYCKMCAKKIHREQKKTRLKHLRSIGTSDFFGHAHKNPEYEHFLIQQEKKRIGI